MLQSRLLAVVTMLLPLAGVAAADSFVNFETGQVRPLGMSPDQTPLFAVNTPDNRLEIFTIDGDGLTPAGSVPVGLDPVAVAARNDAEVWARRPSATASTCCSPATTPGNARSW